MKDLMVAGWKKKYNFMSWALSCLQLIKYYGSVDLVTDSIGAAILVQKLKLPYTNVSLKLEELKSVDSRLWALGKIVTYKLQDQPFLHVDGDVYIWERFSKELERSEVVVQNMEVEYPFYKDLMEQIDRHFYFTPPSIVNYGQFNNNYNAYNAGIIGGGDLEFFRLFTGEALKFIFQNSNSLSKIDVGLFNPVYEQLLLYCLSKEQQKNVYKYSETVDGDALNKEFQDADNFHNAEQRGKLIHLFGYCKTKSTDMYRVSQ